MILKHTDVQETLMNSLVDSEKFDKVIIFASAQKVDDNGKYEGEEFRVISNNLSLCEQMGLLDMCRDIITP